MAASVQPKQSTQALENSLVETRKNKLLNERLTSGDLLLRIELSLRNV